MFKWVSNIWKRPPNRFRVEYLRELWESLEKCSAIHSGNQAQVIERLRELAELLIWGDQHDNAFFEFFLEHNIFGYIVRLFCKAEVAPEVRVQLLQTLSILVENTSRDLSLYYMFSNDKINELITFPMFGPDDDDVHQDELRAYYISFLKTLSLKLTSSTLQFFFNSQTLEFPLFSEAVRFFDSHDSMVRVSVRSLVLNIYRVDDEPMLAYIHHVASPPFFAALAAAISAKIRALDAIVAELGAPQPRRTYSEAEAMLEELVDIFFFINDVCDLRCLPLRAYLVDSLLRDPLTLLHASVVPAQDTQQITSASSSSSLSSSTSSYVGGQTSQPLLTQDGATMSPASSEVAEDGVWPGSRRLVHPAVALHVSGALFGALADPLIVNILAAAILHPRPRTYIAGLLAQVDDEAAGLKLGPEASTQLRQAVGHYLPEFANIGDEAEDGDSGVATSGPTRNPHREFVVQCLEKSWDDRMVPAILAFLHRLIGSGGADRTLLMSVSLMPSRFSRARALLDMLVSDSDVSGFESVQESSSDGDGLRTESSDVESLRSLPSSTSESLSRQSFIPLTGYVVQLGPLDMAGGEPAQSPSPPVSLGSASAACSALPTSGDRPPTHLSPLSISPSPSPSPLPSPLLDDVPVAVSLEGTRGNMLAVLSEVHGVKCRSVSSASSEATVSTSVADRREDAMESSDVEGSESSTLHPDPDPADEQQSRRSVGSRPLLRLPLQAQESLSPSPVVISVPGRLGSLESLPRSVGSSSAAAGRARASDDASGELGVLQMGLFRVLMHARPLRVGTVMLAVLVLREIIVPAGAPADPAKARPYLAKIQACSQRLQNFARTVFENCASAAACLAIASDEFRSVRTLDAARLAVSLWPMMPPKFYARRPGASFYEKPVGSAVLEEFRHAIACLALVRAMRFDMLKTTDPFPAEFLPRDPTFRVGEKADIGGSARFQAILVDPASPVLGPQLALFVEGAWLVVLDCGEVRPPSPRLSGSNSSPGRHHPPVLRGRVHTLISFLFLELEINALDPSMMRVGDESKRQSITVLFPDLEECRRSREAIDQLRSQHIAHRLGQLRTLILE